MCLVDIAAKFVISLVTADNFDLSAGLIVVIVIVVIMIVLLLILVVAIMILVVICSKLY